MANSVRKMIALMVVTSTPAMLMGFREIVANRFFIVMGADGVCFNLTSVSSGADLRKTRSTGLWPANSQPPGNR
jgi:hypothetical protein